MPTPQNPAQNPAQTPAQSPAQSPAAPLPAEFRLNLNSFVKFRATAAGEALISANRETDAAVYHALTGQALDRARVPGHQPDAQGDYRMTLAEMIGIMGPGLSQPQAFFSGLRVVQGDQEFSLDLARQVTAGLTPLADALILDRPATMLPVRSGHQPTNARTMGALQLLSWLSPYCHMGGGSDRLIQPFEVTVH